MKLNLISAPDSLEEPISANYEATSIPVVIQTSIPVYHRTRPVWTGGHEIRSKEHF